MEQQKGTHAVKVRSKRKKPRVETQHTRSCGMQNEGNEEDTKEESAAHHHHPTNEKKGDRE